MSEQDWYAGEQKTAAKAGERASGRRGAHDSRSASPSAVGGPVGASKENATPSH